MNLPVRLRLGAAKTIRGKNRSAAMEREVVSPSP